MFEKERGLEYRHLQKALFGETEVVERHKKKK